MPDGVEGASHLSEQDRLLFQCGVPTLMAHIEALTEIADHAECFFCGSLCPRYRFPHPEIQSHYWGVQIPAGYFLACLDCVILFEDGEIKYLVERFLSKPGMSRPDERILRHGGREALALDYAQISLAREPC